MRVADRYMDARRIAPSTLGRKAVGSSTALERVKSGSISIRTLNRLLCWLSDDWPEHLEWPDDIPRPEPAPRERAA